jgi:hypothetical protein
MIFIAETERPGESDLRAAAAGNPHGAGIAWRERGRVRIRRSLNASEIIPLAASVPLPYVIHFRLASAGSSTAVGLCHPFPVERRPRVQPDLYCRAALAHNGHWAYWDAILDVLRAAHVIPEGGEWSDTRVLTSLVALAGPDRLKHLLASAGRVVILTPDEVKTYGTWWNGRGYRTSRPTACESIFARRSDDWLESFRYRTLREYRRYGGER